jgi:hypothetical protein
MRIHPGAAATISLLLQRGAKDDEIDGIIELMATMDNRDGKTYLGQIHDFDRAIQTYRRKKSPFAKNESAYS